MFKKLNLQFHAEKTLEDILEDILGEDLYKQVTEKLGDKRKIDIVNDGRWFPKEKFDAVNEENKGYKKQINDLNQELGKLKGKIKDNDDVEQTIKDLQEKINDKEKEMDSIRKTNSIKFEVLKANPNDVADILPHLKEDIINIAEDGTITGLEEQLNTLKETKAYLFKEVEPQGTGGSKGGGAKAPTDPSKLSTDDFIDVIMENQAKRD